MLTEFGKFLRKLRIDNGQLLKEMADILGISAATLSSVENGKRNPQRAMVEDIIGHYRLTQDEQDALWNAYDLAREETSVSLAGARKDRQELGLTFARRFNDLSTDQITEIMTVLEKKKKRGD